MQGPRDRHVLDHDVDRLHRTGTGAGEAGVELAAELVEGLRAEADGVVLLLPEAPAGADRLIPAASGP